MNQTPIKSTAKPQLEITLTSEHRASQHLPESINAGFVTLVQISKTLDLTLPAVCNHLEIPERTLRRMRQTKRLESAERTKLEMVSRVYDRATTVLGGETNASTWIKSSLPVLEHRCPLELLTSIEGYETVKTVLSRIASGTY